jgi:hypothetical protein
MSKRVSGEGGLLRMKIMLPSTCSSLVAQDSVSVRNASKAEAIATWCDGVV